MSDEPHKHSDAEGALARVHAYGRRFSAVDPVWAPQIVVLAAIALQFALPDRLTIGPHWLLPALEGLLLVGLVVVTPHPRVRHSPLRRQFAMGLIGLVSAVNVFSLIELTRYLVHGGKAGGRELIFSGLALWLTNVLLFGLWYWELDRGGPLARAQRTDAMPDFFFPNMTTEGRQIAPDWTPGLIDYLYLSLTNSTAFSPTDTMPLTANAKMLMSAQALVALLIVVLVVARAVNILA
ncbi:MAG: hypothetical protein JO321_01150 [Solirubrobacterales bacterium]|nr:hypothetical protein [Solirubrobacterales bacterium]